MKFELDEKQIEQIKEWQEKIVREYPWANRGWPIGGRFEFRFVETSVGTVVKIYDFISKTELDVTDYDVW